MSRIESQKVIINAAKEDIFHFLCDMNNIYTLLPKEKISEWRSDATSCSFKIQGAYTIGLKLEDKQPYSQVTYQSTDNSPISFVLNAHLLDSGGKNEVFLVCDAKINAFLEMMVKGPLKNLFDFMTGQLARHFNE